MNTTFLKPLLLVAIATGITVSCGSDKKSKEPEHQRGINLAYMDTTVNPQENFFRYVNGAWLDQNEIPDDHTSWGSFAELRKNTDDDVLAILKRAISDPNLDKNSDQAKAVYLFESIMDTVARNEAGIEPITPYLERIEQINSIKDLEEYLIEMTPKGNSNFFSFRVSPDLKDSNMNVAYLGTSGLGLPDRDYYLNDDADSKEKRKKYVEHITRMLQFLGDSEEDANRQAQQILAFETTLATPRMDKVERRDARKRYNPVSVDELQKMVPQINWNRYFEGIGVEGVDTIIVNEINYTKSLNDLFAAGDVEAWKTFLRWSTLNGATGSLTTEIERANLEFYPRTMSGAKEQ